MRMKMARFGKLIWVLIYGGLLILCVGLFVLRTSAGLGLMMVVVGAALALAGAVLIALRARMEEPEEH